MYRKLIVIMLTLAVPAGASGGPLKDAVENVALGAARAQTTVETHRGGRFWTGIALMAGGGLLVALGSLEVIDDESGPDDGEDRDDSDDGEDADGWGNKALIGGGVASAVTGGVLLMTGRRSGPVLSVGHKAVVIRHTVRF